MTRPATAKARRDRPQAPVPKRPAQSHVGSTAQAQKQPLHIPLAWPHKVHWMALAGLAIVLRLIYLDHIPGINGDEAWGALKIRQFMNGQRDTWLLVTPTHRYIPCIGLLTWLCEQWGPPSLTLLRLPGAICGVGLVFAGFFAARRIFRWEVAAWSVAALIACLPMHMAYTRLTGADMFVGLGTLALVYCVLRGHWLASILVGIAVSMGIHPIIALLAPAPALLFWFAVLRPWRASRPKKIAVFGLSFVLLGACAWVLFSRYAGRTSKLGLAEALSVKNFLRFWVTLGDTLSGGSSYLYFTGRMHPIAGLFLSVVGLAILGLTAYAGVKLWKQRTLAVPHRIFAACCIMSACLFYAVSPLQNNGIERYCLFLLIPIIFALGLLAQHGGFSGRTIIWSTSIFCWLSVVSFYGLLMRPMLAGASSHETYSTADPEPKAAAMAWIAQDAARLASRRSVPIVADSWWLYWPLAYLASASDQFRVYQGPGDGWGNEGGGYYLPHLGALQQALGDGGYVVAFTTGRLRAALHQVPGLRICGQQSFSDFGGKPLLDALRICSSLSGASSAPATQ